MKEKIKKSTKISAFILSVLMLVVSLPTYAFASLFESSDAEEQAIEESTIAISELEVIEEIMPISARLVANKASFKFKNAEISEMCQRIEEQIKNR